MKSFVLLSVTIIVMNCASVERVDVEEVTDLSGYWNDTDSRLVAEALVEDLMRGAWVARFSGGSEKTPVIIVGSVRNRTSEHIDVLPFVKDIERALVNSGIAQVVAARDERLEVREEREDQQTQASIETAKRLGEELGADFMLQGVVTSQTDIAKRERTVLYQTDMELIDLESTRKAWIGSKKIKKIIARDAVSW